MHRRHLKSVGKSILIGGAGAGIISLIPVINFLNLFVMMWMGFGGGLCVYMIGRENEGAGLKVSEALLFGAAAGALGCVIFGGVSYIVLSIIPPEKIERIIQLLQHFLSVSEENGDMDLLMGGDRFQVLYLTVMGLLLLISLISGALGGIISKRLFKSSKK